MFDFVLWLDSSNVAYLLMMLCFFIMTGFYQGARDESNRLRKQLLYSKKDLKKTQNRL